MSSCRYLKKSKIEITLADAVARGYRACKVCCPPNLDGEERRVHGARATAGHRRHGHARGHLNHRQQRVHTAQVTRLHGHADNRQRGKRSHDTAQVSSLAGGAACAAPRDAGDASPPGYAGRVSSFVLQHGQEAAPVRVACRAVGLRRAAAQEAPLRHPYPAHHHRHRPDCCRRCHLYQCADWLQAGERVVSKDRKAICERQGRQRRSDYRL